jgi:hypothetical protein
MFGHVLTWRQTEFLSLTDALGGCNKDLSDAIKAIDVSNMARKLSQASISSLMFLFWIVANE